MKTIKDSNFHWAVCDRADGSVFYTDGRAEVYQTRALAREAAPRVAERLGVQTRVDALEMTEPEVE